MAIDQLFVVECDKLWNTSKLNLNTFRGVEEDGVTLNLNRFLTSDEFEDSKLVQIFARRVDEDTVGKFIELVDHLERIFGVLELRSEHEAG